MKKGQAVWYGGIGLVSLATILIIGGIYVILITSELNPGYINGENIAVNESHVEDIHLAKNNNIVTFLSVNPENNLVDISVISSSGAEVWSTQVSKTEKRLEFKSIDDDTYTVIATNLGTSSVIFNGYFIDETSQNKNAQTIKEFALNDHEDLLPIMVLGFQFLFLSAPVLIVGYVLRRREKR